MSLSANLAITNLKRSVLPILRSKSLPVRSVAKRTWKNVFPALPPAQDLLRENFLLSIPVLPPVLPVPPIVVLPAIKQCENS